MSSSAIAPLPKLTLLTTRDALAVGSRERLRALHARDELVRLRRGAYVPSVPFRLAGRDEVYRLRVLAAMSARRRPVAAGPSAAVLLGLPTIGEWPGEVYLASPRASSRHRNGVIEIGRRAGLRVIDDIGFTRTSIADMVLDCCRVMPFIGALAVADAALHVTRGRDGQPPMTTLEELWALHVLRSPYQGAQRVRRVLEFSDPRADTPLETLSRVVVHDLGFPPPVSQHPLWLPRSQRWAFGDLAWPEHGVWGEADGAAKYLGADPGSADEPVRRVMLEKRRENEIRALGWRPARWEWVDAWNRVPLRRILLDAGLPLLRRPRTVLFSSA